MPPRIAAGAYNFYPSGPTNGPSSMGRNVELKASPLGSLAAQRNTKTGRFKGVIKSGKNKRQARAWCSRRCKYIPLGTFPTSPEAAVAVATAEAQGIENVPTPKARKQRRDAACRMLPSSTQSQRPRPQTLLTFVTSPALRAAAEQVNENLFVSWPRPPPSPVSALSLANALFDSIGTSTAGGAGCEPSAGGSSLPVLPAVHARKPHTARRRARRVPPAPADATHCAADAVDEA